MLTRPMTPADVDRVARIHGNALSGDFLPSLGQNFLRVFFRAALKVPGCIGFVVEDDEPTGFVLGCLDSHSFFYSVLRKAALQFAFAVIIPILKHPTLLLKAFETFLYPRREVSKASAEVLIIAMDSGRRHQGGGRLLVQQLEKEFLARSVPIYKLTVLKENSNANCFYQSLGFIQTGSFVLFQKPWILYERTISGGVA